MNIDDIAGLLVRLGCPASKAPQMAAQLSKRAEQLAAQKGRAYEDALLHLLKIVRESGGFPKE